MMLDWNTKFDGYGIKSVKRAHTSDSTKIIALKDVPSLQASLPKPRKSMLVFSF